MTEITILVFMSFLYLHVSGLSISLPKVLEVLEGNSVILPCNLIGYNGDVSSLKFYWMMSITMVQSEQILRISVIDPRQSGTYTCYVTVDGKIYNSSVDIIVYYAPKWFDWAVRKFSGTAGSTATIDCMVDSFPIATFSWTNSNNASITSPSTKYTINNSAQKSSLTVNNLDLSDYGMYTCHAENKASIRSYMLQLLEPGLPDSPQICKQTLAKSDSVTVTCVEGYTGGADHLDYIIKVYTQQKYVYQSSFEMKKVNSTLVSLEVMGLMSKQEYTLDVYASNTHGTSSESLSMYVSTAPGSVVVPNGSSNNSKVVALAVCITLLFVATLLISLAIMYRFHMKNKNIETLTSEVLSFQYALNNFPKSSRGYTQSNVYSGELILSQSSTTTPRSIEDSTHTNPAFTDSEPHGIAMQPSLAGCGALKTLQVMHTPAQLSFIPGKTTGSIGSIDLPEERRNLYTEDYYRHASDSWEFPQNKFYLKSKLGEGSFGEVWEGRMVDSPENEGGRTVAIKILRENFTDDEKQLMLEDMRVLKSVGFHPNILQLIGCCTTSCPPCMILEFASRGTLLNLLKQQKFTSCVRLTTKDVESFALQIASAMEHITSLKLLHKDLASRNILMSNDLICKLTDFERELHFQGSNNLDKKKTNRVQVRWLPPESLFVMEKSIKSNIWSFGILVWECFTLGSTPYPGMNNKEVIDFIQRGGRMPKPSFCSKAMYEIIQSCWIYYPNKRASFAELRRRIQRIYEFSAEMQMDFATGGWDSKSWNAGPQDLGEFV